MINYENLEKISVIVPAYNVEQYLERSMNSIIKQTYKNIEIILINDGSTDDTHQICQSYSEKYDEVKYYRLEKNMGISYVRNMGLEKATGEYIGFVDSDDWADETMFETLYLKLKECDTLIAECNYIRLYNNDKYRKIKFRETADFLLDNVVDALRFNIDRNDVTLWNKLYHKSIFDDIRFPVDKDYEDTAVMHLIIEKARKSAVSAKPLYYYNMFFRDDSITSNEATDRSFECVKTYIARHVSVVSKYEELEPYSRKFVFRSLLWLADRVFKFDVEKEIVDRFILVRDGIFEKYELENCDLEEDETKLLILLKTSIRDYKLARKMTGWRLF